ncbi:uncharacterized protein NKAPD1 [Patella vulgata]|uniref:uncharacterized protein NKAPD1 n=1 Tax=Patella vulgata TaxID=6465 RepID=UPI0021801EFC|nr:uncharacterized protein NKAPD1 [Patella vulgata]
MFSTGTKRLLKNYILHTDTHNRIVEETDMWRQHAKMKETDKKEYMYKPKTGESFLEDKRDDMNDCRYNMKSRSAHMDESKDTSTYWVRQLQKTEEADSDRWGHSGYKELYPKDFDSSRSNDESSSSSTTSTSSKERRKRRKKMKRKKEKKKREILEEEKAKKKKSKHKKHKHESSDKSKKHRKKKSDKKKSAKRKPESDSSESQDNSSRKHAKTFIKGRQENEERRHNKKSKHKHKTKRQDYSDSG